MFTKIEFIQRIEYFSLDMSVFTDTVCNLKISSFKFNVNKGRSTFFYYYLVNTSLLVCVIFHVYATTCV